MAKCNWNTFGWFGFIGLAFFWVSLSPASANTFPTNFQDMEIEAKWDIDEATFNNIVNAFPDNGQKYGYDLSVRWNSVPRRYVDVYYDSASAELFGDQHVLRHRQRSETTSSIAITDSFAALGAADWSNLNWQKVQYKSTPTRIAAVWFRTEQGGQQLSSSQVNDTLNGIGNVPPHLIGDNPVTLLQSDHPTFNFSARQEALVVTQYRYRIEFRDPVTNNELYEISLDKVITTVPGQAPVNSYAVELEYLADFGIDVVGVEELFRLMQEMENEFDLVRAITSKGGTVVVDSAFPVLRIDETVLDYIGVEIGAAFTKPLAIYNDGYATLQVSVDHTNQQDSSQWSNIASAVVTAEVGFGATPFVTPITYEPTTAGTHTITLSVSSNDTAAGTQPITLTGQAVTPVPIDTVLVLDRSGSMSDPAGEREKIYAMRDAADLYIHLLRPDSGTGDKIGMVRYNNTNAEYLALAEANNAHVNDAEDKLSDVALTDINRLLPRLGTGIGGAMTTAADMFTVPAGDREPVMIVLTDGIENVAPFINDVIGPITSANPDLQIYSIGIGQNVDQAKLDSIATTGADGSYQYSGELTGVNLFDLENFYFKIFANATGMSLVVDPVYSVPVIGKKPIVVDTTRITSADRKAVFVILDSPGLRDFYTLELIAPDGQVMKKGSSVGGKPIKFVQRHTYTIVDVTLPAAKQTDRYLGDWKLVLTPNGKWDPRIIAKLKKSKNHTLGFATLNPDLGLVPVGFSSAVSSNYSMKVFAKASDQLPGATVRLVARLTDQGRPVTGANLRVLVTGPKKNLNGQSARIRLFDDGTHGDVTANDGRYTNTFDATDTPGTYRFLFRSIGRGVNGEITEREADTFVALVAPKREPDRCCNKDKCC